MNMGTISTFSSIWIELESTNVLTFDQKNKSNPALMFSRIYYFSNGLISTGVFFLLYLFLFLQILSQKLFSIVSLSQMHVNQYLSTQELHRQILTGFLVFLLKMICVMTSYIRYLENSHFVSATRKGLDSDVFGSFILKFSKLLAIFVCLLLLLQ